MVEILKNYGDHSNISLLLDLVTIFSTHCKQSNFSDHFINLVALMLSIRRTGSIQIRPLLLWCSYNLFLMLMAPGNTNDHWFGSLPGTLIVWSSMRIPLAQRWKNVNTGLSQITIPHSGMRITVASCNLENGHQILTLICKNRRFLFWQ